MKKLFVLLIALILLTSCTRVATPDNGDLQKSPSVIYSFDVTYYFYGSQDPILPRISLDPARNAYSFTYSGFSSYLPMGDYEKKDGKLYLWCDEAKTEAYVFDETDKGYVFDAESSAFIPTYKVSGDSDERYSPVPDGALFEPERAEGYSAAEYGGYVKRIGTDDSIKMSDADADAVANIIFDIEWKDGPTDCASDCQLNINGFTVKYHSSCGSLNHITSPYLSHTESKAFSYVLNEADKEKLNSIIERYVVLGWDIIE